MNAARAVSYSHGTLGFHRRARRSLFFLALLCVMLIVGLGIRECVLGSLMGRDGLYC
jgi:hypothetical protein